MARNINRLVWANGFTNDRTHFSNQEPYDKKCTKCGVLITMTPTKNGWKARELTGSMHRCANYKRKSGKN